MRTKKDDVQPWAVQTPGAAASAPTATVRAAPSTTNTTNYPAGIDTEPANQDPKHEGGTQAVTGSANADPSPGRPHRPRRQPSADAGPVRGRAKPANLAENRPMPIPRPGGSTRGGRGILAKTKLVIVGSTAVSVSIGMLLLGVVLANTGREAPPPPGVTASDETAYRLSTYPVAAAGTLAERYMRVCWTFNSDSQDAVAARRALLATMATTAVDPECGWNGKGAQVATFVTFNGQVTAAPEFADGNGRYIGVTVITNTGVTREATVPVYAVDPADGEGLIIAGNPGETGVGLGAFSNSPIPLGELGTGDASLAQTITVDVLNGYFTAWGKSDSVALARFVSADASITATTGLANTLVNPVIQSVTAIPDTDPEKGTAAYPAGANVQASVAVTWTIPGTTPPQTGTADTGTVDRHAQTVSNYRVTLDLTTQGWFVKDLHAGKATAGNFPGAPTGPGTTPQPTPGQPISSSPPPP